MTQYPGEKRYHTTAEQAGGTEPPLSSVECYRGAKFYACVKEGQ